MAQLQSTAMHQLMTSKKSAARPLSSSQSSPELRPSEFQLQDYVPTRQIQVSTIKWDANESNSIVKLELWDVVDNGSRVVDRVVKSTSTKRMMGLFPQTQSSLTNRSAPLWSDIKTHWKRVTGSKPLSTASTNNFDVADAHTTNVYQNCNGVIFLFDIQRPESVEYVVTELSSVPTHLPVLVIASFFDQLSSSNPAQESDNAAIQEHLSSLHLIQGRLRAIRNESQEEAASLQFAVSSLNTPFMLSHASSWSHLQHASDLIVTDIVQSTMRFFELPFLQIQRDILETKLLLNKEKSQQACTQWNKNPTLTEAPMELSDTSSSTFIEPKKDEMHSLGNISTPNLSIRTPSPHIQAPAPALEKIKSTNASTDSLKQASKMAWAEISRQDSHQPWTSSSSPGAMW